MRFVCSFWFAKSSFGRRRWQAQEPGQGRKRASDHRANPMERSTPMEGANLSLLLGAFCQSTVPAQPEDWHGPPHRTGMLVAIAYRQSARPRRARCGGCCPHIAFIEVAPECAVNALDARAISECVTVTFLVVAIGNRRRPIVFFGLLLSIAYR